MTRIFSGSLWRTKAFFQTPATRHGVVAPIRRLPPRTNWVAITAAHLLWTGLLSTHPGFGSLARYPGLYYHYSFFRVPLGFEGQCNA
jgi:hypothetical protein